MEPTLVESILTSGAGEALGASVFAALTAGTRLVGASRRDRAEAVATGRLHNLIISTFEKGVASQLSACDVPADKLEALFRSRDLDEFVRLYMSARRRKLSVTRLRTLRPYLDRVVALYVPSRQVRRVSSALLTGLDAAYDQLASDKAMVKALALDGNQDVEAHLMMLQLDALEQIVGFWRSHTQKEEADTRQLVADHRARLRSVVSNVQPPDFSERKLVPLDSIYVKPSLYGRYSNVDSVVRHLTDRQPGRLVMLGDPGGGKTTLSKYLAHRIVSDDDAEMTVAIVPLRELEAARENAFSLSIVEFITLHSKKQLHTSSGAEVWEKLLRRGAVVVIFDGLDELLQVHRRAEMSQVIESFVDAYPTCPVVVTCRHEGYAQAALDPRKFERCTLLPFEDEQIIEYVGNWFAIEGNALPDATPEESSAAFLDESQEAWDLRANPLILSLLCILFRRRGYIPEHRAEVYGECAELLFETWDRHRLIRVPRYGARLKTLLESIAWWMYENGLNETGVTERDLLEVCRDELLILKSSDADSAMAAAEEFVEHCKGRAWIFSDAGSSNHLNRRFSFTHRSFLEYFAARAVASELRRDPLATHLEHLIFNNGATLMGLLVCQALGTQVDDVVGAFLDRIEEAQYALSKHESLREFLVAVLRYVDLHEDLIVRCTAVILDEAVEEALTTGEADPQSLFEYYGEESGGIQAGWLSEMLLARTENRNAVVRSVTQYVEKSLPGRARADWNPGPLVLLRNAQLAATGLSDEVGDAVNECLRRCEVALLKLVADDRCARLGPHLLILDVVDPAELVIASEGSLLTAPAWGERSALEVLWRSAFVEERVTIDTHLAARIVSVVAEGSGAIHLCSSFSKMFTATPNFPAHPPDRVKAISGEDYEFEFFAWSTFHALLAMWRRLSRGRAPDYKEWCDVSIYLTLRDEPAGDLGLDELSLGDPYAAAAAAGLGVPQSVVRQMKDIERRIRDGLQALV